TPDTSSRTRRDTKASSAARPQRQDSDARRARRGRKCRPSACRPGARDSESSPRPTLRGAPKRLKLLTVKQRLSEPSVERERLRDRVLDAEAVENAPAGRGAESLAELGIAIEALDRRRERGRVADRDDEAGFLVHDEL